VFDVYCGPESAQIILEEIPANYFFYINGDMPYLEIPAYTSGSDVCTIKNYTVYEDISDLNNPIIHPDFDNQGIGEQKSETV